MSSAIISRIEVVVRRLICIGEFRVALIPRLIARPVARVVIIDWLLPQRRLSWRRCSRTILSTAPALRRPPDT